MIDVVRLDICCPKSRPSRHDEPVDRVVRVPEWIDQVGKHVGRWNPLYDEVLLLHVLDHFRHQTLQHILHRDHGRSYKN